MNLETLLSCLYNHREAVARKLDAASCRKLIDYIREAMKTKMVSREFLLFCGSHLSEFIGVSCEKFFPGDEKEITPSNAETFGNKIIEALESPPETHGQSESESDR